MAGIKEKMKNMKESVNDSIAGIKAAADLQAHSRSYNKMFSSTSQTSNVNNPFGSFIKKGRFNILPGDVAFEFNTYKNWAPFSILMSPNNYDNEKAKEGYDSYSNPYGVNGEHVDGKGRLINEIVTQPHNKQMGILGRKSLFNPMTAVNETNEARVSANSPLLDSRELNQRRFEQNDCSIRELIKATQSGRLGVATYSYADFMYCKYLGKCSNEYLITLRRFPYPPGDHINTINPDIEKDTQQHVNDIGRMVTWMGTPGNEMSNILKYSVNIPYEEFNAKIQTVDEDKATSNGILASLMNLGDKRNKMLIESGMGGAGSMNMLKSSLGMLPGDWGKRGKALGDNLGDPPYTSAEWRTNYDDNKSYGPLDVITKTYQRRGADKGGLEFSQDISLRFEYELRSYDGVNGRSAMLDLLANILATCYTTGKFWGGATQFLGASQSNTYTNLPIFMNEFAGVGADGVSQGPGNMAAYARNLASSLGMVFGVETAEQAQKKLDETSTTYSAKKKKEPRGKSQDNMSVIAKTKSLFADVGSLIQNAGSALGSLLYGGLINKLGRPAVLAVNSLLTDAPTGLWHLTIGNPKAPIMSMGNMIIDSCEIEHKGPLGIDGFPTGIVVNVKLKHGKPRENTAIERMYLQGDYRIYSPMGDKLLKMYWGAPSLAAISAQQQYEKQIKAGEYTQDDYEKSNYYVGDLTSKANIVGNTTPTDITNLKRYFGTVAGLGNGVTYLQTVGKEALFGSTSTEEAAKNDNKNTALDEQRKGLQSQLVKEQKDQNDSDKKKATNDIDAANQALENLQYEGFESTSAWYQTSDYAASFDGQKVTIDFFKGDNRQESFDTTQTDWLSQAKKRIAADKDGAEEEKKQLQEYLEKIDAAIKQRNDAQKTIDNLSKS